MVLHGMLNKPMTKGRKRLAYHQPACLLQKNYSECLRRRLCGEDRGIGNEAMRFKMPYPLTERQAEKQKTFGF